MQRDTFMESINNRNWETNQHLKFNIFNSPSKILFTVIHSNVLGHSQWHFYFPCSFELNSALISWFIPCLTPNLNPICCHLLTYITLYFILYLMVLIYTRDLCVLIKTSVTVWPPKVTVVLFLLCPMSSSPDYLLFCFFALKRFFHLLSVSLDLPRQSTQKKS